MDKPRYLKQIIVVRKDLTMPAGKLAAMVAHAAMTFLQKRLCYRGVDRQAAVDRIYGDWRLDMSPDQARWMTELDPGIEGTGQVSMAKIVCAVADETELLAVEQKALAAKLECHRVIDSGCSHNKVGAFVCIAIGPDWPEKLDPVTASLKVYR